jgi:hypothetical protein
MLIDSLYSFGEEQKRVEGLNVLDEYRERAAAASASFGASEQNAFNAVSNLSTVGAMGATGMFKSSGGEFNDDLSLRGDSDITWDKMVELSQMFGGG